jgi:hypothetical protein
VLKGWRSVAVWLGEVWKQWVWFDELWKSWVNFGNIEVDLT